MTNEEVSDFEKCVCGSVLQAADSEDGVAHVMGIYGRVGVRPEWFRNSQWRQLWETITDEWSERHTVDMQLVADRFGPDGYRVVSLAYEATPNWSNAEYYVQKLRDVHLYCLLHKLCMNALQELRPGSVSLYLDSIANGVREIQGMAAKADGSLAHVKELSPEVMDEMRMLSDERFVKKNRRFYIGLPLPWDFLNELYMGVKPGLHIIAALPSQGKTTMGVAISLFWCQQGIKHGFVCIDMTAKELVKRYATLMTQTSLAKLNWGGSPEDVRRFGAAYDESCLDNVEISESYMLERIRDEAYRGVYTHGWKAIVIDYLQLIQDDFKGKQLTYEQVKQVTQGVKQLSKDLKVPIVCLVQLARAAAKEYRESGRAPGLEDLGDSAEIARAASTVSVLVGDQAVRKYWDDNPPEQLVFGGSVLDNGEVRYFKPQLYLAKRIRPVWMYMIKNQQGPTGQVPFVMYPNYFMFRPGNPDAAPETIQIGGKEKKNNHPFFETLRDDWLRPDSDEILEKTGAMGHRGKVYEE